MVKIGNVPQQHIAKEYYTHHRAVTTLRQEEALASSFFERLS